MEIRKRDTREPSGIPGRIRERGLVGFVGDRGRYANEKVDTLLARVFAIEREESKRGNRIVV